MISYDHGIRKDLDGLSLSHVTKYKVSLKTPDDRGLPQGDQFSHLDAIEDELTRLTVDIGGIAVGRVTINGARHFITYTSAEEKEIVSIVDRLREAHGYEILFLHEPDPDKRTYWDELFPTDADWRVILDMRVEQALRDSGDSLEQSRPITHFAYFKSPETRKRFIEAIGSKFDQVRPFASEGAKPDRFGVELIQTGQPDYRSMNRFTVPLLREATKYDGSYDGWEAEVRKA